MPKAQSIFFEEGLQDLQHRFKIIMDGWRSRYRYPMRKKGGMQNDPNRKSIFQGKPGKIENPTAKAKNITEAAKYILQGAQK